MITKNKCIGNQLKLRSQELPWTNRTPEEEEWQEIVT